MNLLVMQFCLFQDALAVQVTASTLPDALNKKLNKKAESIFTADGPRAGYPVVIFKHDNPNFLKKEIVQALKEDIEDLAPDATVVLRNDADGKVEIVDYRVNY